MQRTAVLNVVGLTSRLIGPQTPHLREFLDRNAFAHVEPAFPAVTCTAQSAYVTGLPVREHGIVANGWYEREYDEHRFWKQSDRLVGGSKLWEKLKNEDPEFTCAKLFWWYNMYSDLDYSITPRPLYPADGRKVFDVHTQPMAMRERIKKDLGPFPFPRFWGPGAGLESTRWIAESAKWVENKHWPSLSLVYLPHLDYDFQRYGPSDARVDAAVGEIDAIVGDLIRFYEKRSIKVVILSEYGITDVDRPVHLNRVFREKGWLSVKDELGLETLDMGGSRAFAVADHQVAHVYVNDRSILDAVRETLENVEGVESVWNDAEKYYNGVNHARAGDLVVTSDARSWFTYYYWMDDALAPDFARCVDIHRKCGYDPVELFLDPGIRFPKLKIASCLAKKALGMRMLMDVVPLDAGLVGGSHGRIPEDRQDWPVMIGDFEDIPTGNRISAVDVHRYLFEHCSRGRGYASPALL